MGNEKRKKQREGDFMEVTEKVFFFNERHVQLHIWAGHLARVAPDTGTAMAVRTRGPQWCCNAQTRHLSKWDGVHPTRFSCWRCESQPTKLNDCSDGCAKTITQRRVGKHRHLAEEHDPNGVEYEVSPIQRGGRYEFEAWLGCLTARDCRT